jgi:hypothetical protein
VSNDYGAVGGGGWNAVNNSYGTVAGGAYNTASGSESAVGGGTGNTASGQYATVPGGRDNAAAGFTSFAAGRRAQANLDGCFVWGDSTDADVACTTANQFVARATGGVSFDTGSNPFQINGNTAWHAGNDGAGSGLDADLLDGQHGSYYLDATNINAGTLSTGRYSAYADLGAEGILDNNADTDLLTRLQADGRYWMQDGNSFGAVGRLGTNDNYALELEANNSRALRLEPNATSPNLIGGYSGNWVAASTLGATIAGGGQSGALNRVVDHLGTVGGGQNNQAGSDNGIVGDETFATVAGGINNTASSRYATIGGGQSNQAGGTGWNTIAGGRENTASGVHNTIGGGYRNATSENYATVAGGYLNTTSGVASTIAGGSSSTAAGDYATVAGGELSAADGDYGTVGGGHQNSASGGYGTVSGGGYNTASGQYATVPGGVNAAATHYGEMAYASGAFAAAGDAQASVYVLRRELTMNAGDWHDLFLDGNGTSQRLTIASGRTVTFDILISGRTAAGESAGYHIQGVVENVVGTTALVGTPTVTVLGEDDLAWDVRVIVNDANDTLLPQVQGNGETIRWVATVHTAEVSW